MSVAHPLPDPGTTRPKRRANPPPTPAAIARALPPGGAPATSQSAWLRAVYDHPAVGMLRAHARRNLLAVATRLAHSADWDTLTTRPTWARLMGGTADRPARARRTVARWLRWLREHRLLGIVEHGTTPDFRPAVLRRPDDGNLASVYVLAVARPLVGEGSDASGDGAESAVVLSVDESGTPSQHSPQPPRQNARARTTQAPLRDAEAASAAKEQPPKGKRKDQARHNWPLHQPTKTRAERLALCERLQADSPTLTAIGSPRLLRHLLRPWLLAGWTVAGILHALDHTPDGPPWPYAWRSTRELRNPPGWLLHRMRAWTGPDGPLPDPHQVAAAVAATQRAGQQHHRDIAHRGRAAAATPSAVGRIAAGLRAQLQTASRKALRSPGPDGHA